jgi:large subunit ribosomal protein L10
MLMIRSEKKHVVEKTKVLLARYPVVAVASMQNLPSKQLGSIRKALRTNVAIVVARTTLLQMALQETKPEVAQKLAPYMQGSTALMLTTLNPFELAKSLLASKSKVAAKPGSIAPTDIVVPAGETSLAPGPVLTELKQAGLNVRIRGPRVVVVEDKLVAKKGEAIKEEVAKVLGKLGIEPMEIGLMPTAVWDSGIVFTTELLDVSPETWAPRLEAAARQAMNLALNANVVNRETVEHFIAKAAGEAKNLAINANIYTNETIDATLAKAGREAAALNALVK